MQIVAHLPPRTKAKDVRNTPKTKPSKARRESSQTTKTNTPNDSFDAEDRVNERSYIKVNTASSPPSAADTLEFEYPTPTHTITHNPR
jgi:hypothetical protein